VRDALNRYLARLVFRHLVLTPGLTLSFRGTHWVLASVTMHRDMNGGDGLDLSFVPPLALLTADEYDADPG
jgi:hypothetical protein